MITHFESTSPKKDLIALARKGASAEICDVLDLIQAQILQLQQHNSNLKIELDKEKRRKAQQKKYLGSVIKDLKNLLVFGFTDLNNQSSFTGYNGAKLNHVNGNI